MQKHETTAKRSKNDERCVVLPHENNVTTLQIILTQRVEFHFEGIQVKRIRSPGHVKDNHKNMSLTFILFHDQKKKTIDCYNQQ